MTKQLYFSSVVHGFQLICWLKWAWQACLDIQMGVAFGHAKNGSVAHLVNSNLWRYQHSYIQMRRNTSWFRFLFDGASDIDKNSQQMPLLTSEQSFFVFYIADLEQAWYKVVYLFSEASSKRQCCPIFISISLYHTYSIFWRIRAYSKVFYFSVRKQ